MKRKSRVRKLIISIVVILCLGGIAAYLVWGLGIFAKEEPAKEAVKTYTAASGNLTVEISATGNLALAETEDVVFEMSGTVLEVLVNVGDTVKEGQVLARLDTTDLEQTIKTREKAITTAEKNLASKNTALENAKRTVASQERQISAKELAVTEAEQAVTGAELAVTEAELAVQSGEDDLYKVEEVAKAQEALDLLEDTLRYIKLITEGVTGGNITDVNYIYWFNLRTQVQTEIIGAKAALQNLISENGVQLSSDVALQVSQAKLAIEKKKLALEKAETALEKVRTGVEDAQIAVDNAEYAVLEAQSSVKSAEYDVEDAKSSLQDARDALEEAQSLSSVVTAPFDGFIPSINIKGGAEVQKGTVAVQVASADKFMVEMSVSEDDINDIEVGGTAWVTVDTLGVTLPATVTYIAPTATIQSGVVNYMVRVELTDLTAMRSQLTTGGANKPSSGIPNMPALSGNMTLPQGFGGQMPGGQISGGQFPAMMANNIKLRQGLTVTANLVTGEAKDVLLVPYAAVTTLGRQKFVEVLKADGTKEKRTVTTGLTDYSFIVVTDGLAAGEQVVYSGTAAITTNTSGFGGGMMFPGMGGGFPRGQ